jgi:hypothetical protein
MRAELEALRKLRPSVRAPASHAVARARELLSAEMAAESRALERRGGRWAARRWLVPSIVVVVLGAGGLADAGLGDWWLGGDPPDRPGEVAAALDFGPSHPGASTSRIEPQLELARTVARAPGAALVAVPAENDEGFCLVRVPDGEEADGNCFVGGDWSEYVEGWIHNTGSGRIWYVLGRVREPGAARLVLFEEVTHPFDEREPGATNAEPQVVDVGPGGFYLARVPESRWSELDLAYGSMSVLDESGAQIRRICRYLGLAPVSPLALGGGMGGKPVETADPDNIDLELEQCPRTGSAVREASLEPVSPRELGLAALTGRYVVNGSRFSLSSLLGKPVILAVFHDFRMDTTTRLLLELDSFSRRHPEAQVVALVYHGPSVRGSSVRRLAIGFPVVHTGSILLSRDAFGQFKPFVLAVDAAARVTGELAVWNPWLGTSHALLTQDVLDRLLATATSG